MQFVVGEFEQANAEHCVWLSRSRRQCSWRKVGLIAKLQSRTLGCRCRGMNAGCIEAAKCIPADLC
jgi:hypothetical protein